MADMCGPSNALSNFQKHSTVDRTLQQDRLVARQSPSQGFRSAGPNAGHLDPEFEAFQAGQLPLNPTFQHPSHFPQQIFQPPPGPVNWASDFQRLNISSPPPQQIHNGFGGQIQQDPAVAWHQEFSRQQSQTSTPSQAFAQQNNAHLYQSAVSRLGAMQYSGFMPQQEHFQPQQQQQQPVEQFDEAAFEKAFQDAAAAEVEEVQAKPADVERIVGDRAQEQDRLRDQDIQRSLTLDDEMLRATEDDQPNSGPLDQPLLGSDTIVDPSKPEASQLGADDSDALARTAQQLVNSLSGDSRTKIQNSEFMKLMRGFASGEQGIRGEEVVSNGAGKQENAKEDIKVV